MIKRLKKYVLYHAALNRYYVEQFHFAHSTNGQVRAITLSDSIYDAKLFMKPMALRKLNLIGSSYYVMSDPPNEDLYQKDFEIRSVKFLIELEP
jgi:hypothetical protein